MLAHRLGKVGKWDKMMFRREVVMDVMGEVCG